MSAASGIMTDEKQELLDLLAATRDELLNALDYVAPELHSQHPQQDRWSVLENAEHVVNAEEVTLGLWQKRGGPGSTDRSLDALVREEFSGHRKRKSPERLVPQGRITSVREARERFVKARAETIATLGALPAAELRSRVVPHPLAEHGDGYQLFLGMALHTRQHAWQIAETAQQLAIPVEGCGKGAR